MPEASKQARWQAPAPSELREQDYVPELWRWLQSGDHTTPTRTAGGHKWRTWRELFRTFLERCPLRERCAF
jgi:hypothetical protein